jgi:membrane-associated protein
MHFDLAEMIRSTGAFSVWAVIFTIFAESFFLFFLPGDSLLFTAGVLAYGPKASMNLWVLLIGCFVAAVAGNDIGYKIGKSYGRRLFYRDKSRLFSKKNLAKTQQFYDRHGGKTIILARFIPGVRTFAPIVAGIGTMKHRTFFVYNILGGALWTIGLILLGYFLASVLNAQNVDIDQYLLPIIGVIVVVTTIPSAWHFFQESRKT